MVRRRRRISLPWGQMRMWTLRGEIGRLRDESRRLRRFRLFLRIRLRPLLRNRLRWIDYDGGVVVLDTEGTSASCHLVVSVSHKERFFLLLFGS